jgi:alkaline phosphatase
MTAICPGAKSYDSPPQFRVLHSAEELNEGDYPVRTKTLCVVFIAALLFVPLFVTQVHSQSELDRNEPPVAARNVILMVCDGMGFNQMDAASIYRFGEPGRQIYSGFPVRFAVSTYSADGQGYDSRKAWCDFEYVKLNYTDSSAAATALSTGVKITNKAVGIDPEGKRLKHLIERAEELGKTTGTVTSVQYCHATPAGFIAHNAYRYNYQEISREILLESAVDVLIGAGHPYFDNDGKPIEKPDADAFKYFGEQAVWEKVTAGQAGADADGDGTPDPWSLRQSLDDFRLLATGPTPKRVLGVAQVRETLQMNRSGTDENVADDMPYQVPKNSNVPNLAEMASAALNILDEDPDGFVLLIEGGAVDWTNEGNLSGRMIEEQIDFDEAVEAVVLWIEGNTGWDDTILIVTSDHESGYLTGPDSDPEIKPLVNNGKGKLPGMEWHSGGHTNRLVPFFAKGAGAELFDARADEEDIVRGRYLDNTEIAVVLFELLK